MKHLIWILLAAVLLFAFTTTDLFKSMVGNHFPSILTRDSYKREKSEAGEDAPKTSSPRPVKLTDRRPDGSARPRSIKVESRALVGGWLSEDTNEYIVLRADGKARIAMAFRYEGELDAEKDFQITLLCVGFSDWEINRQGFLEFKGFRFEKSEFRDFKHAKSGNDRHRIWSSSGYDISAFKQEEGKFVREMNEWVSQNRLGCAITSINSNLMVTEYNDGPVTYEKVDPFRTKDPSGEFSPVFHIDKEGNIIGR